MTNAVWYLARGTGVMLLLLLTVVVALGVANRTGRPAFGLPRFAVAMVHRNAALLAVVLLVVHVTALLFDPYAQLSILDVVVPFDAAYRPVWVGLGTLGLDLILALVVTSLLRHRMGLRAWRAVHWLAYAAWPVALLHSLGSGTDAGTWWFRGLAVASACAVFGAVLWRVSVPSSSPSSSVSPSSSSARIGVAS
jgi:sulfoxide reductase heme-binding subunit YedZ